MCFVFKAAECILKSDTVLIADKGNIRLRKVQILPLIHHNPNVHSESYTPVLHPPYKSSRYLRYFPAYRQTPDQDLPQSS